MDVVWYTALSIDGRIAGPGDDMTFLDMVDGHVPGEGGYVLALDLRIVKIIKVVKDDDLMPGRQQPLDEMRPDETRAACDQNSHVAKLATDGHRWTQILREAPHYRAFL